MDEETSSGTNNNSNEAHSLPIRTDTNNPEPDKSTNNQHPTSTASSSSSQQQQQYQQTRYIPTAHSGQPTPYAIIPHGTIIHTTQPAQQLQTIPNLIQYRPVNPVRMQNSNHNHQNRVRNVQSPHNTTGHLQMRPVSNVRQIQNIQTVQNIQQQAQPSYINRPNIPVKISNNYDSRPPKIQKLNNPTNYGGYSYQPQSMPQQSYQSNVPQKLSKPSTPKNIPKLQNPTLDLINSYLEFVKIEQGAPPGTKVLDQTDTYLILEKEFPPNINYFTFESLQYLKRLAGEISQITAGLLNYSLNTAASTDSSDNQHLTSMLTHRYGLLLEWLVPQLIFYLTQNSKPSQLKESLKNQIRKTCIEILQKLIPSKTDSNKNSMLSISEHCLRKHCKMMNQVLLHRLIFEENEENSILATQLTTTLYKQLRPDSDDSYVYFRENLIQETQAMFDRVGDNSFFESDNNSTLPFLTRKLALDEIDSDEVFLDLSSFTPNIEKSAEITKLPLANQSILTLREIPFLNLIVIGVGNSSVNEQERQKSRNSINDMLPYWIKAITKQASTFNLPEKAHNRFVNTQIKILNTCGFLLKSVPEQTFGAELVSGIIGLFKQVKNEQVDLRRELLVAVKYSFSSENVRKEYLDTMTGKSRDITGIPRNWLFDDEFMLGKSTFAHTQNLRSLLCELQVLFITQSRNLFDFEELLGYSKKISKNINDVSFPVKVHLLCCRAINQVIEQVHRKIDSEVQSISEVNQSNTKPVCKITALEFLVDQVKILLERIELFSELDLKKMVNELDKNKDDSEDEDESEVFDPNYSLPMVGETSLVNYLVDCRNLLVNVIKISHKLERICRYVARRVDNKDSVKAGMMMKQLIEKVHYCMLKYGFQAMKVFKYEIDVGNVISPKKQLIYAADPSAPVKPQERETLETLAFTLETMDRTNINTLTLLIDSIINSISENNALILTIKFWIQYACNNHNPNNLQNTTGVVIGKKILTCLVKRIKDLGEYPQEKAETIFKLFKVLLEISIPIKVANLNNQNSPDKASNVQTQPRLLISFFLLSNFEDSDNKSIIEEIVSSCLKYPKDDSTLYPSRYFSLLRLLFRAIGSASPHYRQDQDNIYHAFVPLLSGLLKELSILQAEKHKPELAHIVIEAALCIPVRLSNLLPHLSTIMEPLVAALKSTIEQESPTKDGNLVFSKIDSCFLDESSFKESEQLVQQGLTTLELCVNNLQPEFICDHIAPVKGRLMNALWSALRHQNPKIAMSAFRVLGKFGGSNRKSIKEQDQQKLDYLQKFSENDVVYRRG